MRIYACKDGKYRAIIPDGRGGGTLIQVNFRGGHRFESIEEKDGILILRNDSKEEKHEIDKIYT